MRLVLTNDDGFFAPGLAALWRAARLLPGVQIDVIAPAKCWSGCGHVFHDQFGLRSADVEPLGSILVVEGTPVDCACAAARHPELPRPDWVIAGINEGSNLGVDVYTSGTVAAARQAAIFGIPAVAVSQLVKPGEPVDWDGAIQRTAAVLAAILSPQTSTPVNCDADLHAQVKSALARAAIPPQQIPLWNVNLPILADGSHPRGVRLAPLSHDAIYVDYTLDRDGQGRTSLRHTNHYLDRPVRPGTDVESTLAGFVTLTHLTP